MNFQPFCYQPDVVFEGRNQAYGAYTMRKVYEKRILMSVLIAILAFGIGMGGPVLYNSFMLVEKEGPNLKAVNMKALPPPPVDKKTPPPPASPPPPPPPPQVASIKFPPPVPDEKVKEDEMPPIKELEGKKISTETKDGADDKGEIELPKAEIKAEPILEKPKTDDQIYTVVQQQPDFIGGQKEMAKFLRKNFKYPRNAQRMGITGKVFVRFVVSRNGTINDVTILKGLANCNECNEEAIRLVKMMPAWTPGMQNGNPVNVYFNLPISFTLQ